MGRCEFVPVLVLYQYCVHENHTPSGVDVQDALYNWKVIERISVGKQPIWIQASIRNISVDEALLRRPA